MVPQDERLPHWSELGEWGGNAQDPMFYVCRMPGEFGRLELRCGNPVSHFSYPIYRKKKLPDGPRVTRTNHGAQIEMERGIYGQHSLKELIERVQRTLADDRELVSAIMGPMAEKAKAGQAFSSANAVALLMLRDDIAAIREQLEHRGLL